MKVTTEGRWFALHCDEGYYVTLKAFENELDAQAWYNDPQSGCPNEQVFIVPECAADTLIASN